ncbi:MAG: YbhB/YbcL family Raf kinase inhibitor-like protein [Burkholderiales bacterium]
MKFTSASFEDGGAIPAHHAFCAPDPESRVKLSQNRNPQLAWSDLPKGTQSVVIICHDPDVPSKATDVNKEGRTIPASLKRVNFCHWILIDMPASGSPIRDGEFSSGVTPKGKSGPNAVRGTRQGLNDYTKWFANDENMAGDYFGYDGPCPPWNDSIPHHYVFALFALDVEKCPVQRKFTAAEVLKAMKGHVLGTAKITGLYSLNPAVKV